MGLSLQKRNASGLQLALCLLALACPARAQSTPATLSVLPHVFNSVTVTAGAGDLLESNLPTVSGDQVLSSAGSFGDPARYLQSLPGVMAQSDTSTAMIVRGGNPVENLFLVNGFEVPNLNHIATGSSTGGLVGMVDASLIDSVQFRSSGFSAMEADRLSSVTEINTLRPSLNGASHTEADMGLMGAGLIWQRDLNKRTNLLLSAHHGLANLFTNNIGLDGVPDYTNGIATLNHDDKRHNQFSALLLGGEDTLNISPCWLDPQASGNIQTQYAGWRATGGLAWTHTHSANAASTLRFTDNEQSQTIGQQQQERIPGYSGTAEGASSGCTSLTAQQKLMTTTATPVYQEATIDSLRSLNYAFDIALRHWLVLSSGIEERLNSRNYSIAQPAGTLTPYSISAQRSDAVTLQRNFTSGESSAFAEAALHLSRNWTVEAGLRFQQFDLNHRQALSPRVNTAWRLGSTTLHASLAGYAQQPPAMLMLSWSQNQRLAPMRTVHAVVGIELFEGTRGRVGFEIYHKSYRDLPVSAEYPQVNFENLVDSLDQQFVWLPMTSAGRGEANGAELTASLHVSSRLQLQGAAGWATARFTGLDGVARAGNYEIPITVTLAGSWRVTHSTLLTFRAQAASGRPYTPFDYTASVAQNRGIYNLSQLNALHGPTYSRVDLQLTRGVRILHHAATFYSGLTNVLNQQNLLGYYWSPQASAMGQSCSKVDCVVRVNQMPTQANFGARYNF